MPDSPLQLDASLPAAAAGLLHGDAGGWLERLLPALAPAHEQLLEARGRTAAGFDAGDLPVLTEPASDDDWSVAEAPACLRSRRVDLHLPPDPSRLEAALATEASAIVVDLEECLPLPGQVLLALPGLQDALTAAATAGRPVILGPRAVGCLDTAVCWHGQPVPAALIDVALLLYSAGPALVQAGMPLCLRLSRLESADEARWWASVLTAIRDQSDVPGLDLRCDVAVESVPAAFAMDAILGELRDSAMALCLDRHACLLSFLRCFRRQPRHILPDRVELSGSAHFLRRWGQLMIRTAHRRGALAIGPCASYLAPADDDPEHVLERLASDKERHASDGFDGSGVADPGLLAPARQSYDRLMPGQHQLHRLLSDLHITGGDLVQVARGKVSEHGLRRNIAIALHGYLAFTAGTPELLFRGQRETAASVELAASQLWQCVQQVTGILDDGRIVDDALFDELLAEEVAASPGADLTEGAARLQKFAGSTEPGRWLGNGSA